ncbi:MAG: hypothetical protein R2867_20085 [Caldilineaceae bacterium]
MSWSPNRCPIQLPRRALVEAAEAADVVNMMSLSTRFCAGCAIFGSHGPARHLASSIVARRAQCPPRRHPGWSLGFIQKGGGAFRDMGVHVLDSAWWLLGMPKPVSVTGVAGAKFGPRGQALEHLSAGQAHWRVGQAL